jgi:hypothetical protein
MKSGNMITEERTMATIDRWVTEDGETWTNVLLMSLRTAIAKDLFVGAVNRFEGYLRYKKLAEEAFEAADAFIEVMKKSPE